MHRAPKQGQNRKIGNFIFFLPMIVLLGIIVLGFLTACINSDGVLVVQAQSEYGRTMRYIQASATVDGSAGKTPFNLTLKSSTYTVTFAQIPGYRTPLPLTVPVIGGQANFALGVYKPIPEVIEVSPSGFNASEPKGIHAVTPFVWINTGSEAVQLQSNAFNVVISPSQNYTRVFETPGTYTIFILGTDASQTVLVS